MNSLIAYETELRALASKIMAMADEVKFCAERDPTAEAGLGIHIADVLRRSDIGVAKVHLRQASEAAVNALRANSEEWTDKTDRHIQNAIKEINAALSAL